jgi:hypothetical protein
MIEEIQWNEGYISLLAANTVRGTPDISPL